MTKTHKILILAVIAGILIAGIYVKKSFFTSETNSGAQNHAAPTSPDIPATPDFLRQGMPVLLDLGAERCIPCMEMAKILASLERNYKDQLIVKFIDVNKDPASAGYFKIKVIPTQIFYTSQGDEFYRHEGVMPETQIIEIFKLKGIKF